MFSIIAFLKKSYTRLFIFLPLVLGLLISPLSANALYPSDPSSVDVLKEDYRGKDLQNTEMAFEKLHSTTIMAAKTALLSNAKKLVLTHLSPRYTPKSSVTPIDLLNEAKQIFPNTFLSKDFLTIKIR